MVSDRSNGINWSVIAALAGLACLITVFGIGLYVGTLNYPDEQRHQDYRYTDKDITDTKIAARPDLANAKEYKAPCDKPYGTDESDLCAQWRAAKAAENSAFWTKWGVWIAVIGSSLLMWQIVLTRKAVQDTGEATQAMNEANTIARETAHAQIRAYLMVESVVMRVTNGGINCDVIVRNVGESPATKVIVEVWIGAIISGIIKESDEFEFSQGKGEKRPQGFGAVPKGAYVNLDFAGWGQKDLGIDFKKYIGVRDQPAKQLSVNATLHGTLRWEDVFNQTQCLGFNAYCYKLEKILPDDRMIRANGSITHNPIEA